MVGGVGSELTNSGSSGVVDDDDDDAVVESVVPDVLLERLMYTRGGGS